MNGNAGHNEGNESEDERESLPLSQSERNGYNAEEGGREKKKMGMRMAAAA